MKKIIIGIDDTDNLESKGTGAIASEMCELISNEGFGTCSFITRHQLLLHPDIPYTSHNSSMIFTADIKSEKFENLKETLCSYLKKESAIGSDPGICIGEIEKIKFLDELIEFGFNAKIKVLTMDDAYSLAKKCGLFLKEEGGDGIGIIGALAGVALRIEGNDGEVKGGIESFEKDTIVTVKELLLNDLIYKVCDKNMDTLNEDEEITVKWKVKPVLSEGIPILVVEKNDKNGWDTLNKEKMRDFGDKRADVSPCDLFSLDVNEEIVEGNIFTTQASIISSKSNQLIDIFFSCFNCRYRRWTEKAFTCMKGKR